MAQWADYLISEVHYQEINEKKYISRVRVHLDTGDAVGTATEWTRQSVIDLINTGNAFRTVFKGSDDRWMRGGEVRNIWINNNFYLRTDANIKEEDHLENLPEF